VTSFKVRRTGEQEERKTKASLFPSFGSWAFGMNIRHNDLPELSGYPSRTSQTCSCRKEEQLRRNKNSPFSSTGLCRDCSDMARSESKDKVNDNCLENQFLCQLIPNDSSSDSSQTIQPKNAVNHYSNRTCPHCGIVPLESSFETSLFPFSALYMLGIVTLTTMTVGVLTLVIFLPQRSDHVSRRMAASFHNNEQLHLFRTLTANVPAISISVLLLLLLVFAYNTMAPNHHSQPSSSHRGKEIMEALHHLKQQKEIKAGNMDVDMYYAQILSKLIQCKTISYDVSLDNTHDPRHGLFHDQALRFHSIIESSFPTLHSMFPPKKISSYSLVFEIIPPNLTNLKRKPILLCSHLDVVPASFANGDDDDDTGWNHDPFRGTIVNGCIWGRGGGYFFVLIQTWVLSFICS
jgi:hypothetical protein